MTTVRAEDFAPPGPGLWTFDPVHFPRPVTRLHAWSAPAILRGLAGGQARYGALLSNAFGFVHRFRYGQASTLVPRPAGGDGEAEAAFARAFAPNEDLQRRAAAAERAFATRMWRADLDRWDASEKPQAVAGTLALAAVEVRALTTAELAGHVSACLDHLAECSTRHHIFNMTWGLPLGDFLAQVGGWTGFDAARLLALLEGASPVSSGNTPELAALAAAVRADPGARAALDADGDPAALVAALRAHAEPVGSAARVFFDLHGYAASGGFDPADPCALDRPDALRDRLRAAVAGAVEDVAQRILEATASVRAAVPPAHRDEFDALLEEARAVYRIKDERGMYNDMPARGLVRRAVLEGGRRLQAAGRVERADHLLEAGPDELQYLLLGAGGPTPEDLRDRYLYRTGGTAPAPPATLGAPDSQPVPLEWLPPALQRLQRAMLAARGANEAAPPAEPRASRVSLRGLPASPGTYAGPARVVRSPLDFERIQQGDVLVTIATTPAISAWLPLLGAIVTDHGGPLSHAAIVAREYRLPAVVGTRTATTTIEDGVTVLVDGSSGTVDQDEAS